MKKGNLRDSESNSIYKYFDNNYFFFNMLVNESNTPVENPQFPFGIGRNFGTLYDVSCGIKIDEFLENYNLRLSDVESVTMYFSVNDIIGDIDIYLYGNENPTTTISPINNYNYQVILKDYNGSFYDNNYKGFLFRMIAEDAIRYSSIDVNNIFICIIFNQPEVRSIYVDSYASRSIFLVGDYLNQDDLAVKAILMDNNEILLMHFDSSSLTTPISYNTTRLYISATIGNMTLYCEHTIDVLDLDEKQYNISYNSNPYIGNILRSFDYYKPNSNLNAIPAVITIHGGNFNGGDKSYYNYISPYILSLGYIHINMNYSLMPTNSEDIIPNHNYYQDMLNDIKFLIDFLYSNASTYKIDTTRIILMGYSAGGNLALTYALRSRLSSNNTNYINSSIPIRLVITEGAPTFSELFEENNVVQFGSEAYVQNNDIIDQFKYLFGINDITSLNDISEIQPQSYVSETNLNNISFMMFQGTGFTYYEETESQNFDGDSIVPVCDSTELISCLEEHIGNTPHEANETHIVYSSFFPCSHDNYIYAFINNAHIGGQGDNNYKTALENKLDDIL